MKEEIKSVIQEYKDALKKHDQEISKELPGKKSEFQSTPDFLGFVKWLETGKIGE